MPPPPRHPCCPTTHWPDPLGFCHQEKRIKEAEEPLSPATWKQPSHTVQPHVNTGFRCQGTKPEGSQLGTGDRPCYLVGSWASGLQALRSCDMLQSCTCLRTPTHPLPDWRATLLLRTLEVQELMSPLQRSHPASAEYTTGKFMPSAFSPQFLPCRTGAACTALLCS
jgi:hypothetical protein